ncbi:cadherin repeat domain-containing protein [Aestuariivirga sp.]|uniref:cadherin repeat domain-containing protein n=1 Tax=Aestuariivirga sp. TaxID=2650926 RepID=UPI003593F484
MARPSGGSKTNLAPVILNQSFLVDYDALGGTILGAVYATDPENNILTYSIEDSSYSSLFFIDPATGIIRVADGADLGLGSYTLTIRVTDGAERGVPHLWC